MNPMRWKREHQIAFLIALCGGGLVGALVAGQTVHYTEHIWMWLHGMLWVVVLLWGVFGAAVAGAVVYVRQLLRA